MAHISLLVPRESWGVYYFDEVAFNISLPCSCLALTDVTPVEYLIGCEALVVQAKTSCHRFNGSHQAILYVTKSIGDDLTSTFFCHLVVSAFAQQCIFNEQTEMKSRQMGKTKGMWNRMNLDDYFVQPD